ncbi:hypothetical protein SAMN05421505_110123 [Sinosporangium album]|uniref:Serine-threonine protein kinase n=1 Tax=Sinosporangium album TaxID=504805 RepID=A0A1G7Z0T3_9ACTN|nr:hypothetical protein [Sinosporangium album]SDH01760.1 hypothetical protein SAMN05421505_110123 [Sinosporangium album]
MSHANDGPRFHDFTLVSFDRHGVLRDEGDLVASLVETLRRPSGPPVTDVFVFSHGWLNDRAQATATYREWIRGMGEYYFARRDEIQRRRPGFHPLLVGVHWPSAPWEDQRRLTTVEERVAFYADVIGHEAATDDLRPLLEQADRDPDTLSKENEARLHRLDELSGLRHDRVGAPPGHDRAAFEAKRIFARFRRADWRRSLDSGLLRTLLAPLWVTSFWKMKNRAVKVGHGGVHGLLRTLRQAGDPDVRVHLIGHSFGGVVCAGAVQGPDGASPLAPVHSLTLLQGALSLWSFAPEIPDSHRTGYFHPVIERGLVAGPVVATQSSHDRALGWFYKAAATLSKADHLAPGEDARLPRYGAVGSHGVAGLPDRTVALTAGASQLRFRMESGRCYNVESSALIDGGALSPVGAHSNLSHPSVAALVWEAATSA